jgi:hypothetical protein
MVLGCNVLTSTFTPSLWPVSACWASGLGHRPREITPSWRIRPRVGGWAFPVVLAQAFLVAPFALQPAFVMKSMDAGGGDVVVLTFLRHP